MQRVIQISIWGHHGEVYNVWRSPASVSNTEDQYLKFEGSSRILGAIQRYLIGYGSRIRVQ